MRSDRPVRVPLDSVPLQLSLFATPVRAGFPNPVDDFLEAVQRVRAVLADSALADTAAGGVAQEVDRAAQRFDGGIQCRFRAGEIGDVTRVKRATQTLCNGGAIGFCQVQNGNLAAFLDKHLGGCQCHA